jgi:hypothetical protein
MKTIPTRIQLAPVVIATLGIALVFPALGEDTASSDKSAAKPSPALEIKPDPQRGALTLSAESARYDEGNHFANWNWDFEAERPGSYEFRLNDTAVLKAYVYRSRKPDAADEFVIGRAQVPAKGKHRITLLTGDKSKEPPFSVKGLKLVPVQESEAQLGQGLDGAIELHARDAVTHSDKMQYESKPEDWAEWDFHVSMPGEFKVSLVHGCGNKSGGSEVALLTSKDQVLKFSVKETGGFQNWETTDLGRVVLDTEGSHRVAVQPLSKPGAAVMDIRKIVLTPVK